MPQQPHVYMDINTTVRNMGTEYNQQRPIDMDINSTKKYVQGKLNPPKTLLIYATNPLTECQLGLWFKYQNQIFSPWIVPIPKN